MAGDSKAEGDKSVMKSKCSSSIETVGAQSDFRPRNTHLRIVTSKVGLKYFSKHIKQKGNLYEERSK